MNTYTSLTRVKVKNSYNMNMDGGLLRIYRQLRERLAIGVIALVNCEDLERKNRFLYNGIFGRIETEIKRCELRVRIYGIVYIILQEGKSGNDISSVMEKVEKQYVAEIREEKDRKRGENNEHEQKLKIKGRQGCYCLSEQSGDDILKMDMERATEVGKIFREIFRLLHRDSWHGFSHEVIKRYNGEKNIINEILEKARVIRSDEESMGMETIITLRGLLESAREIAAFIRGGEETGEEVKTADEMRIRIEMLQKSISQIERKICEVRTRKFVSMNLSNKACLMDEEKRLNAVLESYGDCEVAIIEKIRKHLSGKDMIILSDQVELYSLSC